MPGQETRSSEYSAGARPAGTSAYYLPSALVILITLISVALYGFVVALERWRAAKDTRLDAARVQAFALPL